MRLDLTGDPVWRFIRHAGQSNPWRSLIAAAGLLTLATPADALLLFDESGPRTVIVVPESPDPREVEAASDLARVLENATGQAVPIKSDSDSLPDAPALHVGRTRRAQSLAVLAESSSPDAFVIVVTERDAALLGRNPWGTLFAVSTFLQESLGVCWLFPGPLGEVVPRVRRVEVPSGRRAFQPDFEVRNFAYAQVWGPEGPRKHEDFRVWAWHNRVTAQQDSLNPWRGRLRHPTHSFFRLFSPGQRAALPDSFFALVEGRRMRGTGDTGWQFCLSYPPLIEELARRARESAEQDDAPPLFSVSPNDLGNFCECDRCNSFGRPDADDRVQETIARVKDRIRGRDRRERDPAGDGRQSGVVFHFVAEVARRAPKVQIGCYAYAGYQAPPPGLRLPSNVEIWWCQFAGNRPNVGESSRSRSNLEAWRRTDVALYVYEYYGHFRARTPRYFGHLIADDLKELHAKGVRGVHSEATADWALQGFNYWIAAQCLWESGLDADSLTARYAKASAGDGSSGFLRYLRHQAAAWDEAAKRQPMGSPAILETAMSPYPPETIALLESDLNDAAASARGDDLKRTDFFRQGMFYPRLLQEGSELGKRLRADRPRMSLFVAPSSRELVAELPAGCRKEWIAAAHELVEREATFRALNVADVAVCTSTLEITDREYQGGMGAGNVEYLAWKYWPLYADNSSPQIDPSAFSRALERLAALRRGRNLCSSPGMKVRVDSEFRSNFPASRAVNGDARDRGWRSAEERRVYGRTVDWGDAPEHWLELTWANPVSLEAVIIHWGEEGAYWTAGRVELQSWEEGEWKTVQSAAPGTECSASALLIPPRQVSKIRLRQAGGDGPPLRPNLMWVREVECFGRVP